MGIVGAVMESAGDGDGFLMPTRGFQRPSRWVQVLMPSVEQGWKLAGWDGSRHKAQLVHRCSEQELSLRVRGFLEN
jgi:hypothetical protein